MADYGMRGSGRTHNAMRDAPKGAIYVYHGNRSYYDLLRAKLNRSDLTLLSDDDSSLVERMRGRDAWVTIDHAARLTEAEWEVVCHLRRIRGKQSDG